MLSRCSQLTRIGHVPVEGRPLLREGGPISYEARPSGFFQPPLERSSSPSQKVARCPLFRLCLCPTKSCLVIVSFEAGLWEGYRESTQCSGDTYPEPTSQVYYHTETTVPDLTRVQHDSTRLQSQSNIRINLPSMSECIQWQDQLGSDRARHGNLQLYE